MALFYPHYCVFFILYLCSMAMAPMCVCAGMGAFSTAKILTNRGEELEKVLRKLAPKVRFLLGKTWEDHGNITVIYIYIIIIIIIIVI